MVKLYYHWICLNGHSLFVRDALTLSLDGPHPSQVFLIFLASSLDIKLYEHPFLNMLFPFKVNSLFHLST